MKTLDRRSALVGSGAAVAATANDNAAARSIEPVQGHIASPALPVRYYGKYRGTVTVNIDPNQTGRIQAMVPEVLGTVPSAWALPCLPAAGTHTGIFAVPPVGAPVWIEFEAGDTSRPIWSGGYWAHPSDVPQSASAGMPLQAITMATQTATLALSDLPGPTGGIALRSLTGAQIIVNDTGIYISNGKGASVMLIGPTVTINASHSFT